MLVAQASAHIERASYWPDPAPDSSVTPATGGKVPTVRSLYTALQRKPPGATRVVCQGTVPSAKRVNKLSRKLRSARKRHASKASRRSLKRKLRKARRKYNKRVAANGSIKSLKNSIATARVKGYKFRPSEATRKMSKREGKALLKFNTRLLARCHFKDIQAAVDALAQQRPRRDHAGHLHRARVALPAHQRPRPATPSATSSTTAASPRRCPTPTSTSAPTTRT